MANTPALGAGAREACGFESLRPHLQKWAPSRRRAHFHLAVTAGRWCQGRRRWTTDRFQPPTRYRRGRPTRRNRTGGRRRHRRRYHPGRWNRSLANADPPPPALPPKPVGVVDPVASRRRRRRRRRRSRASAGRGGATASSALAAEPRCEQRRVTGADATCTGVAADRLRLGAGRRRTAAVTAVTAEDAIAAHTTSAADGRPGSRSWWRRRRHRHCRRGCRHRRHRRCRRRR